MASWKKHFKIWEPDNELGQSNARGGGAASSSKFSSWLHEVYTGQPNRTDRYVQYDQMDTDSEVNAALDTIAEFCTQAEPETNLPFRVMWTTEPTESESKVVVESLKKWVAINKLDQRIFRIFRSAVKYGDHFFLRDPETFELYWVNPSDVKRAVINEAEGRAIEQYVITNIHPNLAGKVATQSIDNVQTLAGAAVTNAAGPYSQSGNFSKPGAGISEVAISADDVIHISLNEGLDSSWPFGASVLDSVFKIYKQKEMLEDAVIIYRVQRAPERRVFYIDTGNLPSHQAMAFVERVKNEIHQRRIPTRSGGGSSVDASYNPLSILEDFFFAQSCLTMDQKIKLLDGRDVMLETLIKEYDSGKKNFTYTVNQLTHEIEPGEIIWAGKTRLNTQIVSVKLDNGETIKVTPDHRFIMRDGSEVEAQHLKPNDSLMPLYLHNATTGKHQGAGKYIKYTCNATGKQKWVHTMICPKHTEGKETEIHHKDCNSLNNSPDNLIEMDTAEHRDLHRKLGTYHLMAAWNDPVKRDKIVTGIRKYHANVSDADIKMFKTRNTKNGANTWTNIESATRVKKALAITRKIVHAKKTIQYSDDMCNRLLELYNQGHDSIVKLSRVLRNDDIFQLAFRTANPCLLRDKHRPSNILPTDRTLVKLAQHMGYSGWGDFKQTYSYNHKVISVTWLDEKEDTGDITIKSASGSHNFSLTAGVFVHNSDGRGSKVETLPGGTGLGEIDDLRFFSNKLLRGLRIPSSYLPSGPDDSAASFNDGRMGTALIQEFRFNQYCRRLQSTVAPFLDKEFKTFMKHRGVNIDSSDFDLDFLEPQNFSDYREIEVNGARAAVFTQLSEIPYISHRFKLKKFLGLDDAEILENEKLWKEENSGSDAMNSANDDGLGFGATGLKGPTEGDLDLSGELGADGGAPAPDGPPVAPVPGPIPLASTGPAA